MGMVHSPVSVSRPDLDGAHHRRRDDVLIEKTQLRVRQLARNPIFGEVAGGGRKQGSRKLLPMRPGLRLVVAASEVRAVEQQDKQSC